MLEFQLTNEIIIALTVTLIATVAYLAAQVRQNSRAVRSCNRQAGLAFACDVYGEVAKDKQLATLFRSGLNDFSALDASEKVRLHMFLYSMVMLFQDSINAYNEKVITEEEYESNRAAVNAVLRMPGGRLWWQDAQNACAPELRHELNTESDANYALGDIYPYFLFTSNEQHQPAVAEQGSVTTGQTDTIVTAANEDGQATAAAAALNWRKGLARRRTKQNIYVRKSY